MGVKLKTKQNKQANKKINYKIRHESGTSWFNDDLNGLLFTGKSVHLRQWNAFLIFFPSFLLSLAALPVFKIWKDQCTKASFGTINLSQRGFVLLLFTTLFLLLAKENNFILMKTSSSKRHPTVLGSQSAFCCRESIHTAFG